MVILSVHIGGDGPTDGDIFGAWRGRQGPATRKQVLDDLGERNTGLAFENPGLLVKGEKAVEPRLEQHDPTRAERRVSVGAAQPSGDAIAIIGAANGITEGFKRSRFVQGAKPGWKASPPAQLLCRKLHLRTVVGGERRTALALGRRSADLVRTHAKEATGPSRTSPPTRLPPPLRLPTDSLGQ